MPHKKHLDNMDREFTKVMRKWNRGQQSVGHRSSVPFKMLERLRARKARRIIYIDIKDFMEEDGLGF